VDAPAHLPAAQSVHDERPVEAAYLPAEHETQLEIPPVEYLPVSQSVQPSDPAALNFPLPQVEQESAPSALSLPPTQVKQSEEPVKDALPAAQFVHELTPLALLNLPAAHWPHPRAAETRYVPATHVSAHSLDPAVEYDPDGQLEQSETSLLEPPT
jgi:hypothetical protein